MLDPGKASRQTLLFCDALETPLAVRDQWIELAKPTGDDLAHFQAAAEVRLTYQYLFGLLAESLPNACQAERIPRCRWKF